MDYNRTAVVYPNGMKLTSTYDTSARLTRISTIDAAGQTLLSRSYDHEQPSTGNDDTALRYAETDQDGTGYRAALWGVAAGVSPRLVWATAGPWIGIGFGLAVYGGIRSYGECER